MVARLIMEYAKINLQKAMEYRTNFITQCSAMIINDFIMLLFWYLFFQSLPSINGWGFEHMIFLYAYAGFFYGILFVFFGNIKNIASEIANGTFDFYLTLPFDEYTHSMVTAMSVTAVGDLIFGALLGIFFIPPTKWLLFFYLSINSVIIYMSLLMIVNSLGFYLGRVSELVHHYNLSLISLLVFPFGSFSGVTRLILFTIIPIGVISAVPLSLLETFSLELISLLGIFSIVMLVTSRIMFYTGMKKYCSGGAIQVRL